MVLVIKRNLIPVKNNKNARWCRCMGSLWDSTMVFLTLVRRYRRWPHSSDTGEINLRFRRGSVNMCGRWICGQRVRLLVLRNTWTTLDDAEKTHSKTKPKINWARSSPYYRVSLRKNGQEARSQAGNTVCFFKVSSAESIVLEHSFILFWRPSCYCQATINAVRPFCLKDTYWTVRQIRENNKNKNLFHHSTALRFFLCIRFFFF